MNDTAFTDFTASLISVYPIFRAAIFKAFDSHAKKLTRTQQIILLTMLKKETFSMSGLARSISTSNEQATRAITQLVESGMVLREKNKINRRVINISLTDEARAFLDKFQNTVIDCAARAGYTILYRHYFRCKIYRR